MNLFDLFTLTLIQATPLIYAALGGVICERAGIVNIALEGQLTAGAFTGVLISYGTHNAILGAIGGVLAAAIVGAALGFVATRWRVDQIVAGIGINLVALGGAAYGLIVVFGHPGASPNVASLGTKGEWTLVALAFILTVIVHLVLYTTPWGLRLRACGENPSAVADAGISPLGLRMRATIIAGAIAGLGGVFLALGELDLYSDGMTNGRGYIALAAVIFGRWMPFGALGASLFFGFFTALEFTLQRSGIPSQLMQALPYLAVLLALVGLAGRVRAPAADGVPFVR